MAQYLVLANPRYDYEYNISFASRTPNRVNLKRLDFVQIAVT